ncbi:SCO family protein [Ramlibacter alkalitolerans]|uniref:SCO family protein n=1 Tax=Ramlibacter alkalitolerans TaxID=2039631 RepID=A0ABS1JL21_9BURK|nr:SCO family protein [Ramlibacter alkalitolerans]MBL0424606.1 SCO family protein [Ramlibacter alkalitolerans]
MNFRSLELVGGGAVALAGMAESMLNMPDWQAASVAARNAKGRLPNVRLKTHEGRTVRFYDDLVRDKLVVINMMYAGCNRTCPPMTQNLVRVQQLLRERIGRDIFMYSLTVRPEDDKPQDLADFARLHRVGPGWLFLTGVPAEVEDLRYSLGFYDPDPKIDKEPGRHVGMVRIGNDAYRRWGMTPALADPRMIVAAIQHLDRKPPPPGTKVSS